MDKNFFNPPELEVLYALTQLDGEPRQKALAITRRCYVDADHANWWVKERVEELHACYTSGHPMFEIWGQKAYDQLFEMWHRMTGKGLSEYPYPATVSWYEPPVSEEARLLSYFESIADNLSNGNATANDITSLVQMDFCQPPPNEGPFAEYFKLYYGSCPDRVLICGDQPERDRTAQRLAQEFEGGQTGATGRGTSYFAINKVNSEPTTRMFHGDDGLPHYVSFLPSPSDLRLFMDPNHTGAITRRLIRVSLGNEETLFNDLTYVLNFFNQPGCKPALLIIVSPEPLPFDGPILHC